jgi:hypothetical protein
MPYFQRKEDGKFCVYQGTQQKPEKQIYCHDSAEDAAEHIQALMAKVGHGKSAGEPAIPPNAPADWENMSAEEIMVTAGKSLDSTGGDFVTEPVTSDEQDKAEMSSEARGNLPDSAFLYVEPGEKDSEGRTTPRSKRHLPYKSADGKVDLPHLRNAISRLGQSRTGTAGEGWLTEDLRVRLLARAQRMLKEAGVGRADDKPSDSTDDDEKSTATGNRFTVYKSSVDDAYRWLAITNVAIWDREDERLTDKAYDDAITYGHLNGFGQLDLVHVDGTDVGDCDLMLRMGMGEEARLVQGGPWYSDPRATRARKSVQARPDYWGLSIKFVYDPDQFVDGVYHGGIRIKKCTVLPRRMAASHGTAIAVLGGEQKMKELDQETVEALVELGVEKQEIEALAERSKSLPDEQNTKTKEGDSLLDQIKALVAKALGTKKEAPESEAAQPDVVEQSTEKAETEVAPAEKTQENTNANVNVETKADGVTEEEAPVEEAKQPVASESGNVKALTEVVVQSLAPSIKEAMQPLAESLASIKRWQEDIEKRLVETEKDIETKVVEKLESQPPIVKVRTTELKQAEIDEPVTGIMDPSGETFSKEFMDGVKDIVSAALKGKINMPEVKLSE